MTSPPAPPRPRAARLATSALFVVNAFCATNVVPRLPEVRDRLDLSDAALGTAVAGAGLGALVASLAAGPLIDRRGSRQVSLVAGAVLCCFTVLPGVAPVWALLLLAYVLTGMADAVMDVAMNAQGLVVQQGYGRSVLNSFHGWWSIGSGAGALTGAGAAALGLPLGLHLAATGAIGLATLLLARRALLSDPPHLDAAGELTGRPPRRPAVAVLARALGPLVAFAFLATYLEDAPSTWSAIWLTDVLGASAGVAGLGFVSFAAGMTVGRLSADRVVDRFGIAAVSRAGGLAAGAGWVVVLAGASSATTFAGLVVAGLGVAPLFPAMFTAASSQPGIPSAYGLSIASWAARFGFMLAPPIVGSLSDAGGLRAALWTVVAAAGCLAAVARVLRPRRADPPLRAAGPTR